MWARAALCSLFGTLRRMVLQETMLALRIRAAERCTSHRRYQPCWTRLEVGRVRGQPAVSSVLLRPALSGAMGVRFLALRFASPSWPVVMRGGAVGWSGSVLVGG